MDTAEEDICRVCRSEGTPEKPLYHPCVCTGSIKFIHQECLVQWLKHSQKEYCELCKHRFFYSSPCWETVLCGFLTFLHIRRRGKDNLLSWNIFSRIFADVFF
uniref:E3 ubiquitin-protein ligase MARCHF6 n=1 Tax=Ictidomys tridecemlineatus TaxID=43179 RepID=A0A287CRP0_ICTTR